MNYLESLSYLDSFLNYERLPFRYRRQFDLKRMKRLLDCFNGPEETFASVVVAGTKGKGSTARFLSSILTSHGLKTGLYTSPHLMDVRERIQIDGKVISRSDFASLLSAVRLRIGQAKKKLCLAGMFTYFEILTLVAVLHFAKQGVKFGIFEVGMGGRLDATNVLDSKVAVLTPVSFDHEEHLGRTLSKIAAEKAAVIKKNAWVISGQQPPEARRIIEREVDQKKANLFSYGAQFRTSRVVVTESGSRFDFHMGKTVLTNLQVRLPGRFQVENAALAVASALALSKRFGLLILESCIRQGLVSAFWPGRFEIIQRRGKTIVLDGAHNDASMKRLIQAVKEIFPRRKRIMIFGISREKNLARVLQPLSDEVDILIVTKSLNPRAQEPKVVIETLNKLNFKKPVLWAPRFSDAAHLAFGTGMRGSILMVAGSLFLVAEAREYFRCPR